MDSDQPPNCVQLPSGKPVIRRQLDRFQPEFAGPTFPTDVNVDWLVAVKAIEKEPVRS